MLISSILIFLLAVSDSVYTPKLIQHKQEIRPTKTARFYTPGGNRLSRVFMGAREPIQIDTVVVLSGGTVTIKLNQYPAIGRTMTIPTDPSRINVQVTRRGDTSSAQLSADVVAFKEGREIQISSTDSGDNDSVNVIITVR